LEAALSYVPTLVTGPAERLIALDDAKAQLRVEDDTENALITDCIDAATGLLDGYSGVLRRCLIRQKWAQVFDRFAPCLPLPMPALEVASIMYLDREGVAQTIAGAVYALRRTAYGSAVHRLKSQSWPADLSAEAGSITVEFWAGYGAAPEAVPAPIRVAAKMIVATLYEHREAADPLTEPMRAMLRPFALKQI
jgi:uncharacterized phiE125 gp8 family phage protein